MHNHRKHARGAGSEAIPSRSVSGDRVGMAGVPSGEPVGEGLRTHRGRPHTAGVRDAISAASMAITKAIALLERPKRRREKQPRSVH